MPRISLKKIGYVPIKELDDESLFKMMELLTKEIKLRFEGWKSQEW